MKTAHSTTIETTVEHLAADASTTSRRLSLREVARRVNRRHPRDWTRTDLADLMDVAPHGVKWFDALADRLGL